MTVSRPSSSRVLVALSLACAGLTMAGCSAPAEPPAAVETVTPQASEQAAEVADETTDEDADLEAAFAERDAFFAEQKFPSDGSPLVAQTEAQKALIAEQRDWTESQGGTWSEDSESIVLALASDTCETGILNGHDIDAALLLSTIQSSPLVAALIPTDATDAQKAQYEANLASTSIFGAGYLCPEDAEAWNAAFEAAYAG